jgi:hypothetical protein
MAAGSFGKLLIAAGVVLALASCATGRTADTRRGVTDAAYSPLRDVNMLRPEVPLLLRHLEYPYSTATLTSCAAVLDEIRQFDAVLGPESYQPGPNRNIWDKGGDFVEEQTIEAAQDTAHDLIPFRSWVRRLSGATAADREALRAVANGQQRRTFLRGYGASLGCANIIPPPPPVTPAPAAARNRASN